MPVVLDTVEATRAGREGSSCYERYLRLGGRWIWIREQRGGATTPAGAAEKRKQPASPHHLISKARRLCYGGGGGRWGWSYCAVLAVEKDKAGEQRKEQEKARTAYLT
jgi:hypothetical protein